nr:hypothetical protein [Tanacetum cinerariifolium]
QFQEGPPPESPMADNRTMAQLLQAPTEGYEDAIVIPDITANNFKLKHGGNFLDKMPRESLKIIESKSKHVRTDNGTEFKNKNLAKFFDEIYESFQGESSSSSLNDDVQQSLEEVILPQTNTQSIPINMIPNGDEASTSHNVFNERLENAYFDASTSFHDPSNALIDADWVSAMQEELDQFARLKVWRLVPRPVGKSVIKTKWIFKNKKDESSLVIRNKARLLVVGYS